MDQAEFDKFAEEYSALHAHNVRLSGESPEYFAEYKTRDVATYLSDLNIGTERILDFGAGVGGSIPHFRRHLPDARLTCLDVSRASLAIAENRFPGQADFVPFDGDKIPFADSHFDAAFAACVFHHVDKTEHVPLFEEIRRVLRPGGHFFIFEHNPLNPLTVHAVNTCQFDENAVLIGRGALSRRLQRAGFEIAARRYRIFFPRPLKSLRPLERFLTWLPLGAQYYLVGRKC